MLFQIVKLKDYLHVHWYENNLVQPWNTGRQKYSSDDHWKWPIYTSKWWNILTKAVWGTSINKFGNVGQFWLSLILYKFHGRPVCNTQTFFFLLLSFSCDSSNTTIYPSSLIFFYGYSNSHVWSKIRISSGLLRNSYFPFPLTLHYNKMVPQWTIWFCLLSSI